MEGKDIGWPEGMVGPGDRVWVPDGEERTWIEATFAAPGEPAEAVEVEDARVVGGSYKRDVGWVRFDDGTTRAYRYEHIRDRPPG